MKGNRGKELGFSGGKTATPEAPPQSASEAPISVNISQVSRGEYFYAEPTQINCPLKTSLKTFCEPFHIQAAHSHCHPRLLLPLLSGFQEPTLLETLGQKSQ